MSYVGKGHPRMTEGVVLCSLCTTAQTEVADLIA